MVDDFRAFSHLTVPNSELYRSIMAAFVRAKRRFVVHLRPEDIVEELGGAVDPETVTEALRQLVGWTNLRADPDTSRVTTVEDFHRARFLYQLTERGEAVEEGLAAYDEALGRRGALQAVALADIIVQLHALVELARQPDPDPVKVHLLLRGLVDRFTDLAGNARVFMGSLQRTIDLQDVDLEVFRAYKDRLIDYLERFVKDLVATGAEIARLVDSLDDVGVRRLLDLAAWREAEDAAPGADGGDDPRRAEFERVRALWNDRWAGFRAWFVSEPHHPSQAKLLRARARAAIPQLLQVVSALNERRSGRSDRSADFRELARWFAQAPDDAALHRLWRVAFGIYPARHLTADVEDPDAAVPPTTSWADAPPLSISPRLRRTGSYERRGKPNRVVDRSAQRRHLAELATREAAETAAARARLATDRPTRLSDLAVLDSTSFRLFLGLLGDALAQRVPDGRNRPVETTISDGTMVIRLTPLVEAPLAEVSTADGVFRGPEHIVEIVDLVAEPAEERSA